VVAAEDELDKIYDALCQGQSLNPDDDLEDQDGPDGGTSGIDLNSFTWAPGYGPNSLFGNGGNVLPGPGAGGDTARQLAHLNVLFI